MPGELPYLSGLGDDERAILDEMIRNGDSKHWEQCRTFVAKRIHANAKAKDIPRDDREDVIQEIMYKTAKYLPSFRFDCTFKSWLHYIINNCINDQYRRLRGEEYHHAFLASPPDERDGESAELWTIAAMSAEESFMLSEKIHAGMHALFEYANNHANSHRNRLIIHMVILESHTHVKTAEIVGCDAGVVGYVIREAQEYAREQDANDGKN